MFELYSNFINKSGFQKEYHCCISLGFNCYTSMILRKMNLQIYSYPFDWSRGILEEKAGVLGLEGKIDLLCSDFERWIEEDDFVLIDKNDWDPQTPHLNVRNVYTGLQYVHDFEKTKTIAESYPNFKEKYTRRKNRLLELINSGEKIAFVFYAGMKFLNDDIVLKCFKKFQESFPKANFDVLFIQNNPYMDHDKIAIEHLTENITKVTLYNYEFIEKTQGTKEIIQPRLEEVFSKFLIVKSPSNRIYYPDELKSKFLNQSCICNPSADYSGIISFGPYTTLQAGKHEVTIAYELSADYAATYDIVYNAAKNTITKGTFDPNAKEVKIQFELTAETEKIEIRTFVNAKNKNSANRFILKFIRIETIK